jgi:superfamily II DNA or RNA helicase
MNRVKLIGDIYKHWKSLASDRPTIGFASGVEHSIAMRDEFREHGVTCEHIDGSTPSEERDEIIHDLHSGDVQVVWNCDCLSEGFDCPSVSCVILAAPTRSIVKFRQRAGRALRPAPGKEDCLLIDHCGAVLTHGYPDEDIPWTLEGDTNQCSEHRKQRDSKEAIERVCPKCKCIFKIGIVCPNCGHKRTVAGKPLAVKNGLLRKVKRADVKPAITATKADKQAYWHHAMAIAANKNLKCGAAAHMYKKRFGCWPRGLKNMPKGRIEWTQLACELFPQYTSHSKTKHTPTDGDW